MEAVMDACRARGAEFTAIADPLWSTGVDPEESRVRKGLCDWLKEGYRYWFHTGHGKTSRFPDGTEHAQIEFPGVNAVVWVYGDDYWKEAEDRDWIEAFSDIGVWPSQYHIVMLNCCWSGGHYLWGADPSIANAFGNYGAVENDQTYLGWRFSYYPTDYPLLGYLSPSGTAWTKEFWRLLGIGCTVSQAVWWANMNTIGWMRNFLWMYGGPDATYFDPY
jgi:hypothetical protein